jgi:microcystin-dependent protein
MPVGTGQGQTAPSPTTYLGGETRGGLGKAYATPATQAANPTTMAAAESLSSGGGQPHNNLAPYVAVNYIIALQGIFPARS